MNNWKKVLNAVKMKKKIELSGILCSLQTLSLNNESKRRQFKKL